MGGTHKWPTGMSIPPSLGEDVRRVRRARRISQTAFASATGYTQSYVSRVESGEFMPSLKFAEACDRTFGTGDLFVRQLRRVIDGEYPAWFAPHMDAEREAETIRDFSTTFIVGLLQTEAYARAVLRQGRTSVSDRDLEAKTVSRLRRREILERADPPRISVVLHEACLCVQVGSSRVMAEQLRYLIDEMRRRQTLTLQVLPYPQAEVAISTPFAILELPSDAPRVYVEGPQVGQCYDAPKAVRDTVEIFDRLRACALSPDHSLDYISSVKDDHERNAMDQVQLQRRPRRQLRRVGAGSRVRLRRGSGAGQ
ncbi:helix-turn-helix transcriptional regulator [Streptomyces sp. NPDC006784]|uniref:helix-turn-helix domain-containing protein n=1 Tax=Streptomyces sp. NPDC006784 TaxID=3364764 RepID=UPI0036B17EF5